MVLFCLIFIFTFLNALNVLQNFLATISDKAVLVTMIVYTFIGISIIYDIVSIIYTLNVYIF
jgi:hypothetical protein